jgi:hypothetical protein
MRRTRAQSELLQVISIRRVTIVASQSMGESVSNFNRFIERAITNMALLSIVLLIPLLGAAGYAAVYTTHYLHVNNRMSENGMNI